MSTPAHVIPPGQEAHLRRMVEPPRGLFGGFRLVSCRAHAAHVEAHYRSNTGTAVIRLVHRDEPAPEGAARTAKFAIFGRAAPEAPGFDALLSAVTASVRAHEAAFRWAGVASIDDLELHLDLIPYLDLEVSFDHQACLEEAMALLDRFVAHDKTGDPKRHITWRSLALRSPGGDARRTMAIYDRPISDYSMTDIAPRCPNLVALVHALFDLSTSREIILLLVEPGGRVEPHSDAPQSACTYSVNVALNMPPGAALQMETDPGGGHNAFTFAAPFSPGTALLLNVAKHHYAVNTSDTPRIHLRGPSTLRMGLGKLLELARKQNGDMPRAVLIEKLLAKYRALRQPVREDSALARAMRPKAASLG